MACKITPLSEIQNLKKNIQLIYKFEGKVVQADSVEALDHSTEILHLRQQSTTPKLLRDDNQERYSIEGLNEAFFSRRVTHSSSIKFEKSKTPDQMAEIRRRSGVKTEGGSFVHDISERIGKRYVESIEANQPIDENFLKPHALNGVNGFSLNESQYQNLKAGVVSIIDSIYAKQRAINRKFNTTGKVEIRFEQVIGDPVRDMAGTMDVLAVFSNNTAMIYDYKTMSPGREYVRNGQIVKEGFVYPAKKETWKLQQGTYKKILVERYGIKKVTGTRIVPIFVDYTYNKKEKAFTKDFKEVLIGEQQSEFLKQIMATYESTSSYKVDEFLKGRYKRLKQLKDQLKGAGNNRDKILNRIEVLEDSIYKMIVEQDFTATMENIANVSSKLNDKLLKNEDDVSLENLLPQVAELRGVIDFISYIEKTTKLDENKDDELLNGILESIVDNYQLINELNTLEGYFSSIIEKKTISQLEEHQGEIRDDSGRIILKEDNAIERQFNRTSQWRNPLFREVNRLKDIAYQDVRDDIEEISEEVAEKTDNVKEWLESKGEVLGDLHKYILNPTTNNMFSRLSKDYMQSETTAFNNNNSKFFVDHYNVIPEYQAWYDNRLEEIKEELELKYKNEPESKRDIVEAMMENYIDNWKSFNNLELNTTGTAKHPKAWTKGQRNRNLIKKESTYANNGSIEYKFILANPSLKEYYEMMEGFNKRFRSMLEQEYGNLPNNFLPKIRASFLEKLQKQGISSTFSDIKEIFAIRQDEQMFGELNEITHEYEKKIPVYWTNNFTNEDGSVNNDEMSKDLGKSLILFAKMALNFKHMSKIEAQVLALQDVLDTRVDYFKLDTKGRKIEDSLGDFATYNNKDSETRSTHMMDTFINYYLYGQRIQQKGRTVGNVNSTKLLLQMKQYMSLKALGLGFIPGGASFVAALSQHWVEGNKGIIYTKDQWKQASKLMWNENHKYNAMAYYFGTLAGDVTEHLSISKKGKQFLRGDKLASGGIRKYVNSRNLMRPYSYGDERLDNHITVAMALNYGFDERGNLDRLKRLPEGTKSIWEQFEYNHSNGYVGFGEYNSEGLKKIKRQFRNAVREANQNIKGTMNEEDITYSQTHLMWNLMMHFKTWMPGIIRERFGGLKYNSILQAPQWGRYTALWEDFKPEEGVGIAMYIMEALKYLLFNVAKDLITFGYVKNNPNSEKGKTYFNKWVAENPELAKGMSIDDFIEIQEAAIKGAMSELRMMLMFMGMITAMGMDWDDDGEPLYKEHWALHKIFQVLNRTYLEIGAFVPLNINSASEFTKLVRSPLPIAGLLIDLSKLMGNTMDELMDIITGRDDNQDRTEKLHYLLSFIPGGLQFRRLIDYSKQDQEAVR